MNFVRESSQFYILTLAVTLSNKLQTAILEIPSTRIPMKTFPKSFVIVQFLNIPYSYYFIATFVFCL